jgi:hypothetical protein
MNVHLQNIVSDAISIIESEGADRRRIAPFARLLEEAGSTREAVRDAVVKAANSAREKNSSLADQLDELIPRIDRLR